MTKICILQNGLARGGTDTFVVNLCKALDKSAYEITVVNPDMQCNIREQEILDSDCKILHTTKLSSFKNKLKHLIQLYRILKKGKFDVFQTNIDLFNGPNLMVAKLAGVPIRICHSHNAMQLRELVGNKNLALRVYQKAMRFLSWHCANRHCGCSTEAMNFLYKGHNWHQNRYPAIIYNSIDLELYTSKIDIHSKKEELGLKASKHIVTIGRFHDQKNPLFLARVFAEFCKINNDTDLIWIGEGPLMDECKTILKEAQVESRVHFLGGRRSDVDAILKCCDLFVLPSNFEGLGIVLIEAQATGLPCLISENITKDVNCGGCKYKSLSDSVHSWAETINEMLADSKSYKPDVKKVNQYSLTNLALQMQDVMNS